MSLIIKGIDLPKETKEVCVMYKDKEGYLQTYIVKDIIQIPKGSRLIDANEISKDLEEWKQRPNNDDDAVVLVNHFQGIIRTAPTILESEVMLK